MISIKVGYPLKQYIPLKDDTVAEKWAKNYKGNRLHSLQSIRVEMASRKIQTYQFCVQFILCLTWTVNANSLKQNIIVIKEIGSWLPPWLNE